MAKEPKPIVKAKDIPVGCKCILNKRTQRGMLLCPVTKTDKHRSGWSIKGRCETK